MQIEQIRCPAIIRDPSGDHEEIEIVSPQTGRSVKIPTGHPAVGDLSRDGATAFELIVQDINRARVEFEAWMAAERAALQALAIERLGPKKLKTQNAWIADLPEHEDFMNRYKARYPFGRGMYWIHLTRPEMRILIDLFTIIIQTRSHEKDPDSIPALYHRRILSNQGKGEA